MDNKKMTCSKRELYQKLAERDQNRNCIVATVVEGPYAGSKVFMQDGEILCQWGEGWDTWKGNPGQIEESGLIQVDGRMLFCEKIGTEKTLVICGAGHVSIPIIELGRKIGFRVIVIEDRLKFAENAIRAGADQVICDSFENGMEQIPGSPDTYFVIVTRGHRFDTNCLRSALKKEHAYIGMMGSRKRVGIVLEQLSREGFAQDLLDSVCAPIGLHIHAETPEEIAVSIVGELIQVKNQTRKISNYEKDMLSCLTGEVMGEVPKVLSTIISRQGSAPREIGTKMLILDNGDFIGTIGGGCAESKILTAGRWMLRDPGDQVKRMVVDMGSEEAADAGMVCGGRIEVLLERI